MYMQITPHYRNAKKHPQKQIDQVAASIKEFGMNQPIVVDKDGVIIVGHGRYEALKQLGMEIKDEYIKVVDLTEKQANAYRLADNKLNESDWDMNLVIEELKTLEELAPLTGFDMDLLIEPEEKDDEVPEVPEEPQSKLGDIYELGGHRVLCGDSTKLEDVERLMDGKKADMVFTDPPYNALRSWKKDEAKSETRLDPNGWFANDNLSWEEYDVFLHDTLAMLSGHSAYVCCDFRIYDIVLKKLKELDWELKHCIVWNKNAFGLGKRYRFKHEFIIYVTKGKAPFYGGHGEADVWEEKVVKRGEHHKTAKPVDLPARAIKNSSQTQELVMDLFLGSGSTLIAAEKTGRICYGMELDPKYVDVIVQRYVDYTGNATIKKNGEEIVWKKTDK